jgi:hypothetical protein
MAFTTTVQFGSFAPMTVKVPVITTGVQHVEKIVRLRFGSFPPRIYAVSAMIVYDKKRDVGANSIRSILSSTSKNVLLQIQSDDCVRIMDVNHVSILEGTHENKMQKQ